MKKTTLSSTLVLSIFLFIPMICFVTPQNSYADAPKDVTIKYDSNSQTLTVTITHKSSFPSFHHIKNVEVKKNSALVNSNNYDTQPKEVPFTYTYKVAAALGDKLEATATCNLSGSKTATLSVAPATK
jgi:desulfoferrodoxin (superoxide reductase-like protein)